MNVIDFTPLPFVLIAVFLISASVSSFLGTGGISTRSIKKTIRLFYLFKTLNTITFAALLVYLAKGNINLQVGGPILVFLGWLYIIKYTKMCLNCGTFNSAKGFMKGPDTCSKCGESLKKEP